jgi:hypothetical protein
MRNQSTTDGTKVVGHAANSRISRVNSGEVIFSAYSADSSASSALQALNQKLESQSSRRTAAENAEITSRRPPDISGQFSLNLGRSEVVFSAYSADSSASSAFQALNQKLESQSSRRTAAENAEMTSSRPPDISGQFRLNSGRSEVIFSAYSADFSASSAFQALNQTRR